MKKIIFLGSILLIAAACNKQAQNGPTFNISPSSGKEGTEITISYPKALAALTGSAAVSAQFTDPGEHGWHMVTGGAATYVTYDPAKGLKYTAPAKVASAPANSSSASADTVSYTTTVPYGICGLIIQSNLAKAAPPKVLDVSLIGADGKALPGLSPAKFNLICDKYTLQVKINAAPDPLLPDGVSQSTITANLSVTGPAQIVIGQKISKPTTPIIITSPLGLVMVHFDTTMGTMTPAAPVNIKTDLNGDAIVTLSSTEAGIARVRAQASGIGDASVDVHFEPKITGVKQDFVEPNSPTNDEISTIPADSSKLDFHWEIIYPAGQQCGNLTGPADGKGLNKNGYFHGPTGTFPNGCDPQAYEAFVKVKVTVTDKDGQSNTKIFPARAFEGQGLVKLP
jgi:hypothetical protein